MQNKLPTSKQNTGNFPQDKTLTQSAVRNPKAGDAPIAQSRELGPEDGKN